MTTLTKRELSIIYQGIEHFLKEKERIVKMDEQIKNMDLPDELGDLKDLMESMKNDTSFMGFTESKFNAELQEFEALKEESSIIKSKLTDLVREIEAYNLTQK